MTPPRRSLTSKQRQALYERCRGEKDYPDCNICGLPIQPGQRWHESHDPRLPRALGGDVTGIAHERCNLDHAHTHDVPLIAKTIRRRQKHTGAFRRQSRLPGAKDSNIRITINKGPVDRRTGEPLRRRS